MSSEPSIREPDASELEAVATIFLKLRDHFAEWDNYGESPQELIEFAYYEGCGGTECCGELLELAAPVALGDELVSKHGFKWRMIRASGSWHYGVVHTKLQDAIDLQSLEDGSWCGWECDEEPDPGKRTVDSLESIVRTINPTFHRH